MARCANRLMAEPISLPTTRPSNPPAIKQATELGAQVRKGEKGSLVVYADSMTKTETDGSGEEKERIIPFMKGYTVFNTD